VQHSNAQVMGMTLLSRGNSLSTAVAVRQGRQLQATGEERKTLRSNNKLVETAMAVVAPLDTAQQ